MNPYNIFKPVSLFFFAMISFIGSDNAFAITYPTQTDAYNSCNNYAQTHCPTDFVINSSGAFVWYHSCNNSAYTDINCTFHYTDHEPDKFGNDGLPLETEPDISECTATGTSTQVILAGDADYPDHVWLDGCKYESGFGACYSTDSWVTKNCNVTLGQPTDTREPDETCTENNVCPSVNDPEETEQEPITPEQIDESETSEEHPDYDHPTDTEPDTTEHDQGGSGDVNITMDTSDDCTHEITIKPDGTVTENITGTDCETIIYPNRDYGTDDIEYTDPSNAPSWNTPSQPGTTGGSETPTTNPNPVTRPSDVDIDTEDQDETTCDPTTQDCSGEMVGLLSDIKELLNYDDQTSLDGAADTFDIDLEQAGTDMEAYASQEIDIDGFNIDSVVKDVLQLPSAPPVRDTLTISADFHLGQKDIVIENMHEQTSMLRTFLKWMFWIFAAFSSYQILFSRPII